MSSDNSNTSHQLIVPAWVGENQFIIARGKNGHLEQWHTFNHLKAGDKISTGISTQPHYWRLERLAYDDTYGWSFYAINSSGTKLYVTYDDNGNIHLRSSVMESTKRLFDALLRSDGGVFLREPKNTAGQSPAKFLTTDSTGHFHMVSDENPGREYEWFILKTLHAIGYQHRMPYYVEMFVHEGTNKWISQYVHAHTEIQVNQSSIQHEWRVTTGDRWSFFSGVYHAHHVVAGGLDLIHLDIVDIETSRLFPAEGISERYMFQSPQKEELYVGHDSGTVTLTAKSHATWWEPTLMRMSYVGKSFLVHYYPPLDKTDLPSHPQPRTVII
uniref:uncharacterized protein LOC120327914 n=1 Tax=Styela clava TaxID=7725 RepID=UPI0019395807|nr:uncharacterized protein LOC120327914 [Styela clava]